MKGVEVHRGECIWASVEYGTPGVSQLGFVSHDDHLTEVNELRTVIRKMRLGLICLDTFLRENPNIESAREIIESIEVLSALNAGGES